jgi:hypothetical protein
MLLKLLLITIALVGLAFTGFAVKMFFRKNGTFVKSCGSVDPVSGKRMACSCGEAGGGEKCRNKEGNPV